MPAEVLRLRRWARVVLVPVGLIGAALSFASIYEAALPSYGPVLAAGFPFLVDFLILGASLQYIAGAKVGRPRAGWRLTAHAGVAGTLVLNAFAAPDLLHLPWHVIAPAVWSVLVEMTAREVLGEWRASHQVPADRIPVRLWLTAPVESARTWLLMARVGAVSHRTARVDVGVMAAAGEALRLALPGRRPRRVRRIIRRQLRAGSLPPADVLTSLGWSDSSTTLVTDPALVLRATLLGVLTPAGRSVPGPQDGALRATIEVVAAGDRPAAAAGTLAPAVREPVAAGQPLFVTPPAAASAPPSTAASAPAAVMPPTLVPALGDAPVEEETLFPDALDAPRRPFNDPIFLAPRPAAPEHAHDDAQEPVADGAPAATVRESTGDRPSDAVALLRAEPGLTAVDLAVRLRALGWVLSDRTANRVFAEARHYLRPGRLSAVQ